MIGVILLSIIQGISEFLPISSSAHLIISREIFKIGPSITGEMALSFDLAVHLGTLIAIVVYFFKDFLQIVLKGITKGINDKVGKVFLFIVIATIPAALIGVLFEDVIENIIRDNLYVIATALAVMGIIIYLVDKKFSNEKEIENLTFKGALVIGIFQAFALIPGFSRSGTTITAGRFLKLNRESSAKFSFYLSAPITLGAILYKSLNKESIEIVSNNMSIFLVGIFVSFLTGIIVIEFLLKYLRKHDFKIFMWYRLLISAIVFAYLFL